VPPVMGGVFLVCVPACHDGVAKPVALLVVHRVRRWGFPLRAT
jgi:hypothetical protein